MNVLELRREMGRLVDEAQAVVQVALAEKRSLTDEETTKVNDLKARAAGLKSTIELAESLAGMGTELEASTRTQSAGNGGAREATRVHNNAEDAPFGNFGEFLQCVRDAAIQPSGIDPRLHKRAALGANEKVGSEGGFLVGTDVSPEIMTDMNKVGVIAPRCTQIPISSNSNSVTINGVDETSRVNGSRWGGVQAYWSDEAGTTTATKPKFRQIRMQLSKLHALYYATDEVIADAATLGSIAQRAFAEEMAFKVDDAIFRGNGAGQPQGILNSGALISVSKETGQAAATIVYENLVKMYSRIDAASRSRAAWFVNQDVEPQLLTMSLKVGTGGAPVYLPPGGASGSPFSTLLGRPVIPVEFCETLGTVGDIVLADFSAFLLATKGGVQQAQSMHVQFTTGEMAFRFTYRVDGQTQRSTAKTPFKGTATTSAFVALATRA